jgi:hypothetical protein
VSGTTRTYGPLHFEDLEPHRFEDLVRQLVYDFRPWRALEATGRAGGDEGFDARGFEITDMADVPIAENDGDDETPPPVSDDRLWLIQCKRERSIAPAKLKKHLDDIPDTSLTGLYGALFVGRKLDTMLSRANAKGQAIAVADAIRPSAIGRRADLIALAREN